MRLIPSPTPVPMNLLRSNQITPTTIASAMRKSLTMTPYNYATTIDNFPKDTFPSRNLAHSVKHHHHNYIRPPSKYIIHHVDESDNNEEDDDSFLSMLNPFECESEESDDENDEDEM